MLSSSLDALLKTTSPKNYSIMIAWPCRATGRSGVLLGVGPHRLLRLQGTLPHHRFTTIDLLNTRPVTPLYIGGFNPITGRGGGQSDPPSIFFALFETHVRISPLHPSWTPSGLFSVALKLLELLTNKFLTFSIYEFYTFNQIFKTIDYC